VILAQSPGPARNRQVPRAPSPASGVTLRGRVSGTLSGGVTHRSSLLRTHPPVLSLLLPWFVSLVQQIFAGCCQPLLERGPSRRYLRHPCRVAWTLTPRCSFGAYPFLPEGQRPRHRDKQLGTPNDLCKATSTEGNFRGCSHSLMFRLLNLLGPPVAPTARPRCVLGGQAVYATPNPWQLPDRAVVSLRA
jgi:hypothetical protein